MHKQSESDELDKFIYGMSRLDIEKLDKVLAKLKEISKFNNKEKKILSLEMKLENAQKEVEDLKQQLSKANETIESYKVKFENYKKVYGV